MLKKQKTRPLKPIRPGNQPIRPGSLPIRRPIKPIEPEYKRPLIPIRPGNEPIRKPKTSWRTAPRSEVISRINYLTQRRKINLS